MNFDAVNRFVSRMRIGGNAIVEIRGATRGHQEKSRLLGMKSIGLQPGATASVLSSTTYDEAGVPTATYRRFQWGVDGFPSDADPATVEPDYASGWMMT